MSIVTVQLGQCGNQIGYEVFDTICRDLHNTQGFCCKRENEVYQASCKEHFFNEEKSGVPIARALLIDMEPKVISQTLLKAAHSGRWKYGQHSHFCQKQGSGNNWAYGYSVHGPKHEESIMNLIQKEVEKYDSLRGFSTIMSMAGGTGSGLGAFLTQNLRDAYPNSFIINQIIWPYGTGEVIVQNYNSVLTLSHLYRSSDALLVHENDVVHKICAKLMNIKQISFRDVNQVIAHQLGSVFQPTYSPEDSCQYRRNPLGDLMASLVPHPEFKMLGLRNIPQMSENSLAYTTFAWTGLLKHLRQMLISNAKMEEGKKCIFLKNVPTIWALRTSNINRFGPARVGLPNIVLLPKSPSGLSCFFSSMPPKQNCKSALDNAVIQSSVPALLLFLKLTTSMTI